MSDSAPAGQDRLAELRASAKGWHGIQLAALGFIGLCGVIQTGESSDPWALQVMSAVLVLVAFVFACAGICLVGRAAWPLYRAEEPIEAARGGEAAVAAASRQLTRGLLLTFLSIAALALATAASWWPKETDGDRGAQQVQVRTEDGRSACGTLGQAPQPRALRVIADAQAVDVPLDAVASIAPAGGC
jgi:hypothetical protein